jgi:uncharacterized protein (TIGR02449 family)
MLAELQHLQTLIKGLTEQLQDKRLENQQLQAQLAVQVSSPQDELARLNLALQLEQLQSQYAESEKAKHELAQRHATLTSAHQQMDQSLSDLLEKRANELTQSQADLEAERAQFAEVKAALENERDVLLRKNEFAKQKVEAIIHRLSLLGQSTPASDTAN